MSKFGTFFKRLIVPVSYEKNSSSSPSSPSKVQVNQPTLPSSARSSTPTLPAKTRPIIINTQSCTTSPRTMSKQVILNIETTTTTTTENENENNNTSIKSNYLTSEVPRSNLRRLSAPLFIHTSPDHPPVYSSTLVNQNVEEALLLSLHRVSLSSPTTISMHSNSSNQNLTTSIPINGSSACSLTRSDIRSGSVNISSSPSSHSNILINNISTTSGKQNIRPSIFGHLKENHFFNYVAKNYI